MNRVVLSSSRNRRTLGKALTTALSMRQSSSINSRKFNSLSDNIINNNGSTTFSGTTINRSFSTVNSMIHKAVDPELSETKYITVKTPEDVVKNSNVIIEWLKVEGDPVEDNEIVCRIDRQPVVGDEIREMQADYKGIIHKIPFEPKPTREDIGKKLNVKMSPNQELYVLQTTEQEIRSQETVFAKIKRFVKQYGALGIVIYFGIYFLVLGTIFLLLQQGVFATKDVLQWLHSSGLDKLIDMSDLDKSEMYANAGVAWVLTKFTEPLRMAVTLAITPSIYRLLKKLMRK
ncbi:DUF1279 domain-containing protein [Naegleria gruberi]|uniref:DUF1279 domain-containing protein n=1 Tax=Naegleria gruberi TaxID=5762 RepID=D2V2N5_NAEGR|nr:DUF1279 domain-containing protein [Naegleria gruberi]EFC49093.1 DUF1279 domain-containing protein [Naegleria gruberi]|eukprot:XP_002681837.1 DUF1279 domain-containing protein [Naegleria gruberi strain NEG-M]